MNRQLIAIFCALVGAGTLLFAGGGFDGNQAFQGTLDELQVWAGARTQAHADPSARRPPQAPRQVDLNAHAAVSSGHH